jgi:hypothetical protein
MEMSVREIAYKMGIDGDQAEDLERVVGTEATKSVLETVGKKVDYQETLPFHPRMRTPDSLFAQEAANCRKRHATAKARETRQLEFYGYIDESDSSFEKGYRPEPAVICAQIESALAGEIMADEAIELEDYEIAKRFLDSLEEEK